MLNGDYPEMHRVVRRDQWGIIGTVGIGLRYVRAILTLADRVARGSQNFGWEPPTLCISIDHAVERGEMRLGQGRPLRIFVENKSHHSGSLGGQR